MRKIILATVLVFMAAPAFAASNPQRISRGSGGLWAPVYVNNSGTNQTNAHTAYANQTQYTPAVTSTFRHRLINK